MSAVRESAYRRDDKERFTETRSWQSSILPIISSMESVLGERSTPASLLVLEWESYFYTLIAEGRSELSDLVRNIEGILQEELQGFYYYYLAPNRVIVLIESGDKKCISERVRRCISRCVGFGVHRKPTPIYIQLKAGYACVNGKVQDAMDNAFVALLAAKGSVVKSEVSFDDNKRLGSDGCQQIDLGAYILEALATNKLRLAFQPIVSAKSGIVTEYEALLRIVTETRGILSAGSFIVAAENLGFVGLIDHFVLESVVRELEADDKVRIAMNISRLTITDGTWYLKAKKLLKPQMAHRLTVEVTETAQGGDLVNMAEFVDKVKAIGCKVAIDDFGTGYTSFKQLKLLSADVLKIDGVFIKDIVDNPDSRLFVKLLLEFAHAYGLETVAEYVETAEMAKVLMELGVDYLQGFYFSQALNYRPWINQDII